MEVGNSAFVIQIFIYICTFLIEMIKNVVDDIRGVLVIIFAIVIIASFIGATLKTIPEEDTQTREAVQNVGESGINAIMIIFVGMGIIGTIGLIITIISFFKNNFGGII